MFSYMWHTPDQPFTELGAIYSGTTYFSRYLYLAGLVSAHLPCLLCLLQSNFSEEAMAHCSHCSCFFSQNAIVSSTLPPTASKGSKAMSSEGQESSGQGFPSAPPCVPSKTTGISCRYPVAMKAFSRYVMLVEYWYETSGRMVLQNSTLRVMRRQHTEFRMNMVGCLSWNDFCWSFPFTLTWACHEFFALSTTRFRWIILATSSSRICCSQRFERAARRALWTLLAKKAFGTRHGGEFYSFWHVSTCLTVSNERTKGKSDFKKGRTDKPSFSWP